MSEKEYYRGVEDALALIKKHPAETVLRNYGHSLSNPYPDDYDRGYRNAIKAWNTFAFRKA